MGLVSKKSPPYDVYMLQLLIGDAGNCITSNSPSLSGLGFQGLGLRQ